MCKLKKIVISVTLRASPVMLFNVFNKLWFNVGLSWDGNRFIHERFVEINFIYFQFQLFGNLWKWNENSTWTFMEVFWLLKANKWWKKNLKPWRQMWQRIWQRGGTLQQRHRTRWNLDGETRKEWFKPWKDHAGISVEGFYYSDGVHIPQDNPVLYFSQPTASHDIMSINLLFTYNTWIQNNTVLKTGGTFYQADGENWGLATLGTCLLRTR